ncbi:MAG TPA: peptide chain release factor N(5)-glutamine methyltransferase [Pirellulales bacterium]|jgi:release factor glutamine methyltransferase|nr:peptide chain release factor N(5)-glutamine methyltransferase [Pirellulales bacterium]
MAEEWTVGRLLEWTADYLKQHGSASPRLEAEVLLAHARGCQRIELYTSFGDSATEALRTKFRELVRRRAEGMPVAYLVGHREFYSLDFRVTPDVLIPRPETELLVMTVLDRIKAHPPVDRPLELADVGTGSGIIAITAARHAPSVRVTALDVSVAALAVARDNAQRLGVAERIAFVESDLLAAIDSSRKFDCIASNPPYVSTAELADLPREVKAYEPELALAAGPSGTNVIERLIPQAAERLTSAGTLLLEISPMLQQRVESLIASDERLQLGPTIKDLAGLARVVQATRK